MHGFAVVSIDERMLEDTFMQVGVRHKSVHQREIKNYLYNSLPIYSFMMHDFYFKQDSMDKMKVSFLGWYVQTDFLYRQILLSLSFLVVGTRTNEQ